MTKESRHAAWLICVVILAACGGGDGGAAVTLRSIAATPLSIPLAVGSTQALTVTGTYSNSSTAPLTSGLTFASDNPAVATISAAGVVTAVSNGTAHITITDAAAAASATPVTVTVTPTAASGNTLNVVVDSGPAVLEAQNPPQPDTNILFATITICTPGSTTACQVIDHVQVDTGSTGLGIMSSVLTGVAVPQPIAASGGPLRECLAYADGYVWGSMAYVDVQLGGRTLAKLPVNLMGDPAAGAAPSSCTAGYTTAQNEGNVVSFGANGVLGIGYFLQDCGAGCVTTPAPQAYYACPSTGCVASTALLNQQMTNPVGALAADHNGLVIVLPTVTDTGQASASGTLYFGIGTEVNNTPLGNVQLLTVVDNGTSSDGTLTTVFNGSTLTGSVIDSGSTGYFFDDSAIKTCSNAATLFCPVTASGAATTLALSASIQGENGVISPQDFMIGNADSLSAGSTILTALPTLGGPNASLNGSIPGFDWGLPFFYGKSVYILFETNSFGATNGPAVGF